MEDSFNTSLGGARSPYAEVPAAHLLVILKALVSAPGDDDLAVRAVLSQVRLELARRPPEERRVAYEVANAVRMP